jgi:hypothetical protein
MILSKDGNSKNMAGYSGYSKSNNAIDAESRGLMTASQCGKALGIPSKCIKKNLEPVEWHHTSKFFNETDYYDCTLLIAIKNEIPLKDMGDGDFGFEPSDLEMANMSYEYGDASEYFDLNTYEEAKKLYKKLKDIQ